MCAYRKLQQYKLVLIIANSTVKNRYASQSESTNTHRCLKYTSCEYKYDRTATRIKSLCFYNVKN